jgi:hypothetical protein
MLQMGFEFTIQVFERANTVHALNRAATVIGWIVFILKLIKMCQNRYFSNVSECNVVDARRRFGRIRALITFGATRENTRSRRTRKIIQANYHERCEYPPFAKENVYVVTFPVADTIISKDVW